MLFSVVGENGSVIINLPGYLCLQLAVICVVLYGSWRREGKLAESIRSVLLPAAIGQFGVLLLTVAFQLTESLSLIRLDNWLNTFYARHHRWLEVPPLVFGGIVITLIVLSFLLRVRLVTHFLTLQKYLQIAVAALATFASFTFAAQYPYSLGLDRDAKVIPRQKSREEEVETKQLNKLSAAILEKAFSAMPRDRLIEYANLVQRVDQEVGAGTQHEETVRNSLKLAFSGDLPPPDPTEQVAERAEETSSDVTGSEAWLGLKSTMVVALSSLIHVPEGIVGEAAKSSVEYLSEQLSERGYRSPVGDRFNAVVDKVAMWLSPRLQGLGVHVDVVGTPDPIDPAAIDPAPIDFDQVIREIGIRPFSGKKLQRRDKIRGPRSESSMNTLKDLTQERADEPKPEKK
jgi:hypothetical protein